MKTFISRVPKKLVAAAISVGILVGAGVSAGAWWPERPTYTMENPASYVTFNSITNNPNYGDERTFFDAKPTSNTSSGGFVDKQQVQDGQELLLRVYVHNNAADNLNGTNNDGIGVAKGAKARIHLPTATDTALRANAYIGATNAKPAEVSDTVDFAGSSKFNISYVPGSAIMYTNAVPSGFKLNDSLVTTGAPIGYTGADGIIPGCLKYSGIITIKVKVKMDTPDFTVEKTVSKVKDGQSYEWKEDISATPGETVAYQIRFTNKGNAQLDKVAIRDVLPAGFKIVSGSTRIKYGSNPEIVTINSDAIVSNGGLMIGSYSPGSGAVAMFKATAPKLDGLKCGENTLQNVAEARVGSMATTDTANVKITKECEQKPTPKYSCDALTVETFTGRKIKATVKYTAKDGATFNTVMYDFGDQTNKLVTDKTTVEHTYAKDGQYTIKATVNFLVDGKPVSDSGNCNKTVKFESEKPVPPVTPPTTPTPTPEPELPNTGVGSIVGLFAGISLLGALGHRLWIARR